MSAANHEIVVHKFGGTSLADATRFRRVAEIVAARPERTRIVVVSAMSRVTDALIGAVEAARARETNHVSTIDDVLTRHQNMIGELVPSPAADELLTTLENDAANMGDVLHAVTLLKAYSRDALELVSGYGEVWSAQILAAHLAARGEEVTWLDARRVLVVDWHDATPRVDWEASQQRLGEWVSQQPTLPRTIVVTGFIAETPEGVATTLGRNGSDFSASIFAVLFGAHEIHIWTDVDGVMSADPRLVPDAVTLDALSYDEAMELAYFGAKVIHPGTMAPAVERGLAIFIRNTFKPEQPGTRIHFRGDSTFTVKGLATIESIALLNVEGTGMIGVPGTAQRLFGALRDAGISVIMISQGSSEHSICFAVRAAEAERARTAVEQAFFAERHHGQIEKVELIRGCSILAVVGDGMAGKPGVAARFFSALGKAGVNIRAIAQGSSERNISVVVDEPDTQKALRAAHSGFYLSDQTLSIGLVGPGNVGSALLRQLAEQITRLKHDFDLDLRVRAIASSKRMLLGHGALELRAWRDDMERRGVAANLDEFAEHVQPDHLPHAVIIDCTASQEVSRLYNQWLARGIHVITPNKRANTAELSYYRGLREANRNQGAHYLYETTVGAALPIVQTLRDLVQTGDDVIEIEGILSGTLSYLFNSFDGSRPFSAIVEEAKRLGYTEPDPRDDLSGTDVARKIVILAREMGLPIELSDVDIQSLVPEALKSGSIEEFMRALPGHDAEMTARHQAAARESKVLRFVGSVTHEGKASAQLRSYPTSHPFARIQLTDNIVLFRTRRYSENPLVVQGPGAGPEVTAAGVFADLLRLSAYLGAPL